ncbi:ribosomal protein S18-alanine N-acetyltransferase [Psychrobacter urativorans]|uniref:ribosomal protein S18-alanine N-acetyltransferase n=1 Tax=Psychrobacter urativorans TaxID=45610 RepID=UPI001917EF27|nr:ribosomal protein S18-alanine N-acetyltransferase [Psychrobacter urativorans]
MLTVEKLTDVNDENEPSVRTVASIEAIVQLQEAWDYKAIIELLAQDSVQLLIIKNGVEDIVGYCLYQMIFEQAEILRIGTHPDYQRQGIASQLFIKLNKELQDNKVENLLLEVRADNLPAIALYERQGFIVIHQRKGYYSQPNYPAIDALIMQLKL